MELKELLEHFNNGDTLGEDFEVIELMRYYSLENTSGFSRLSILTLERTLP